MAGKTAMLHIRIEPDIKEEADYIFGQIGITTSDAVKIVLRKAICSSGFPFEVKAPIPNEKTIAAMEEAKRIAHDPNAKTYSDFNEILKEIDEEIAAEEKAPCLS